MLLLSWTYSVLPWLLSFLSYIYPSTRGYRIYYLSFALEMHIRSETVDLTFTKKMGFQENIVFLSIWFKLLFALLSFFSGYGLRRSWHVVVWLDCRLTWSSVVRNHCSFICSLQRYRKRLFCFANFGRFRDVSGYP